METKLKIAIIDSGVYHAHKDFFETKIYEITPSGSPVKSNVRNGHGTAVYNIIRKECATAVVSLAGMLMILWIPLWSSTPVKKHLK